MGEPLDAQHGAATPRPAGTGKAGDAGLNAPGPEKDAGRNAMAEIRPEVVAEVARLLDDKLTRDERIALLGALITEEERESASRIGPAPAAGEDAPKPPRSPRIEPSAAQAQINERVRQASNGFSFDALMDGITTVGRNPGAPPPFRVISKEEAERRDEAARREHGEAGAGDASAASAGDASVAPIRARAVVPVPSAPATAARPPADPDLMVALYEDLAGERDTRRRQAQIVRVAGAAAGLVIISVAAGLFWCLGDPAPARRPASSTSSNLLVTRPPSSAPLRPGTVLDPAGPSVDLRPAGAEASGGQVTTPRALAPKPPASNPARPDSARRRTMERPRRARAAESAPVQRADPPAPGRAAVSTGRKDTARPPEPARPSARRGNAEPPPLLRTKDPAFEKGVDGVLNDLE